MGSIWHKSRDVEWYLGEPATGAKAYFFPAGVQGTTLTVYQDGAETTPHAHPVLSDGNGRWPLVFIPYSAAGYGVRVTNEDDIQLWLDDGVPNPDPVEFEIDVPLEETVQTGMMFFEVINGTRAGCVRANGRTVGNASSGASERAAADTEALFTYFWNGLADSQAPVSSGRGGSAAADFAANKTITLPDFRGKMPIGLDTMGSGAASRFTGITFSNGNSSTPGSQCGANTHVLSQAELPAHTHAAGSLATGAAGAHDHGGVTAAGGDHNHTGTSGAGGDHAHGGATAAGGSHDHAGVTGGQSVTHTHGIETYTTLQDGVQAVAGTVDNVWSGTSPVNTGNTSVDHTHTIPVQADHTHVIAASGTHTHTISSSGTHTHVITAAVDHTHTMSGSTGSIGSGTAHNNIPLAVLGTWYIKL